jgi:hypothetical protein
VAYRFTLRSLLLALTALAPLMCCVGIVVRTDWQPKLLPREAWPRELHHVLKAAKADEPMIGRVKVTSVGMITEYCWRMPASDALLHAHLNEFKLKRVATGGVETERILERLPDKWRPTGTSRIAVYSNRPGQRHVDDGEFLFILLHDQTADQLLFYYYFNF